MTPGITQRGQTVIPKILNAYFVYSVPQYDKSVVSYSHLLPPKCAAGSVKLPLTAAPWDGGVWTLTRSVESLCHAGRTVEPFV